MLFPSLRFHCKCELCYDLIAKASQPGLCGKGTCTDVAFDWVISGSSQCEQYLFDVPTDDGGSCL